MITHLNYIEDKELREEVYQELSKLYNTKYIYVAVNKVDPILNVSKILAYTKKPILVNDEMYFAGDLAIRLFNNSPYLKSTPSLYDIFSTHDVYDVEKLIINKEEDQKEIN